jgi:hypothetical protein
VGRTWRQLFVQSDHLQLNDGCTPDDLRAAERRLDCTLPTELRAFLTETDGVYDLRGQWYVAWPLARIVADNLGHRVAGRLQLGAGLVAFGDDGTGNPFCLTIPRAGCAPDPVVYWWGWIGSESIRLADSLQQFWERLLHGEIRT